MGYTRADLVEGLKLTDGGTLSDHLHALIASDYVVKYLPFGKGRGQEHFRLVDPFCLFYHHFKDKLYGTDVHFWQNSLFSGQISAWRGLAFEQVCFNHVEQIKQALEIGGVLSTESAWVHREGDQGGMQIDLLISRKDNVINMCEIKYSSDDFAVNKTYYRTILGRQERLMREASPKMTIHSTLITTFGLKENEYSGVFVRVITMEDLFR